MQIYVYIFYNKTLFSMVIIFIRKELFFYNIVIKCTILSDKKIRACAKYT